MSSVSHIIELTILQHYLLVIYKHFMEPKHRHYLSLKDYPYDNR
jgi:hypothetical protein